MSMNYRQSSTIVAASVFLWSGLWLAAAEHTKEPLESVKRQVESQQAVLVDVREPAEWVAGHLRDAQLLALSQIRKELTAEDLKHKLPKDKPIYLHCKSGARCLLAAEILEKAGFEVRPLRQGYDELLKAGFPKAEK